MLDVNERLNSLSGYDMRDVTTADSDETTLNGKLQLPVADPGGLPDRAPMAGRKHFFTCSHIKRICSPGPHYIKLKLSQD
jgi:hypothetical protein